jgi:putative ABC transport system substrate-binding protein
MNRRAFITLIGATAAVLPLAARAQQPKVPTIGALVIGNINPEMFWREFRQGLRDLGYVEGQNIRFEFRSAEGHLDRLPELAAELVRLKVDIIVTWFTPTALAAKQATHEIPIVMAETGDPVGTGLVASLPRPGGNVTGMAAVTAELAGKSVQLIRDMLPRPVVPPDHGCDGETVCPSLHSSSQTSAGKPTIAIGISFRRGAAAIPFQAAALVTRAS